VTPVVFFNYGKTAALAAVKRESSADPFVDEVVDATEEGGRAA
jgi:hypothetical protein